MSRTRIVPIVPGAWGVTRADAPAAPSLVTALVRLLFWPARMLRARRDFVRLAELGDRELRDIGLTRQDLRNATALPHDENPTGFLAGVAAERARAGWARARRAEEAGTPPPPRRRPAQRPRP